MERSYACAPRRRRPEISTAVCVDCRHAPVDTRHRRSVSFAPDGRLTAASQSPRSQRPQPSASAIWSATREASTGGSPAASADAGTGAGVHPALGPAGEHHARPKTMLPPLLSLSLLLPPLPLPPLLLATKKRARTTAGRVLPPRR